MKVTIEQVNDDVVSITIHTDHGEISLRVDDGLNDIDYIGLHRGNELLLDLWPAWAGSRS